MCSSASSLTNNEIDKYNKVHVYDNGTELTFMVAELAKFSDIETEVFDRIPELINEKLIIHYYGT